MSFLGLGGLARRRVDQQGQAPPAAVSPGSSNVVRARLVIVSGAGVSGVFVYSGTPGLGNPPIVSITSGSVDPFGNTVIPGLDVTQGSITGTAISGNTISGGTISGTTITGTTFEGTDFIVNSAGAFFYFGTPAANNLAVSIAGAAGTDGFGNPYVSGVTTFNADDTFSVNLFNSSGANASVVFDCLIDPFQVNPALHGAGTGSSGSSLQITSGQSGAGSNVSSVICQDSTEAARTNGQVVINSGGLSGQALLSGNTFQGPLDLPLPHQTTGNANIASGAGTLSAADRTSLNGLINAVNTLQGNLQSAGMES